MVGRVLSQEREQGKREKEERERDRKRGGHGRKERRREGRREGTPNFHQWTDHPDRKSIKKNSP